jgi:L,D-peptidoglycan transpeptidase YkuD (ErfK/YbiS/YcfS/YnhG family)
MPPKRTTGAVPLFTLSARSPRGTLRLGHQIWPCAIGRGGRRVLKREGDGASPIGRWPVRSIYYRADRLMRPVSALPVNQLRRDDGWCDAPADRRYNRRVRHPYPASAEHLWRDDHLYDLIVVLGHNDRPRRRGSGSAIFIHAARPGYLPTEGCIALAMPHLKRLVHGLRRGTRIVI